MKDVLITVVLAYFVTLAVSSIFAATVNINNNKCLDCKTMARLEYAFPVKQIACWLSEEVK